MRLDPRGFQQATIEEIARRAGMSKATMYLYYKNNDDLFLDVVNEKHELDFHEKHGLAVAPKEHHKRLFQDMYLTTARFFLHGALRREALPRYRAPVAFLRR